MTSPVFEKLAFEKSIILKFILISGVVFPKWDFISVKSLKKPKFLFFSLTAKCLILTFRWKAIDQTDKIRAITISRVEMN